MREERITITQAEMREVLAGQRLYVEFVETTRSEIDAGAKIQKGPLTIDLNALRSRGVPLKIIVPTPGWLTVPLAAFGPVPGGGGVAGPGTDIQKFLSLLDPTAGPERRRRIVNQYELLVAGYRMSANAALALRRNYLRSGIEATRAGSFLRGALVFNWKILCLRATGFWYLLGLPAPAMPAGTLAATAPRVE